MSRSPVLRDPRLSTVLRYRNDAVVRRFAAEYGLSMTRSRRLFVDLLTYFWVANKYRIHTRRAGREQTFAMLAMWFGLDEMWHTFLLFTPAYDAFCRTHFGRYIHHQPELGTGDDPPPLDEYVQFTYDMLGYSAVVRWFRTYPRTLSRPAMMARRIASMQRQLGAR
jgi:hypothetical protein